MKKLALPGLAMGAALIAVSTAQAQPLTLATDQMEQVTAGGYFDLNVDVYKNLNKKENLDVWKTVFAGVFVKGNLADAEAGSQAYGPNSLAETLTLTNAYDHGGSDAFSQSLAAVNGDFKKRPVKY
jgi:hypothetical protein